MQRLVSDDELQRMLERGLITGKWSIAQFNRRDYWHETKFHKHRSIFPDLDFSKNTPNSSIATSVTSMPSDDMNLRSLPRTSPPRTSDKSSWTLSRSASC